MILLKTEHLEKKFIVKKSFWFNNHSYITVNKDINLSILTGETFGIVGESGSGKTTLSEVIIQLSKATKGNVFYYGSNWNDFIPKYIEKTINNISTIIPKLKTLQEQKMFVKDSNNILFLNLLGTLCLSPQLLEIQQELLLKIKIHKQIYKNELKSKYFLFSHKNVFEDELQQRIIELEKKIQIKKNNLKKHPLYHLYESFFNTGINLTCLTMKEKRFLRKDLQIISQDSFSALSPYLTIGDLIGEGLLIHGICPNKKDFLYRDAVIEMMHKCGLSEIFYHKYMHELSGGQRQRVNIARSLILKPKFVVCDESVSSLDVTLQLQILDLLNFLKRNYNLTYLFITHDLGVANYVCDRIAVMYLGIIVEMANVDEIFQNPLHPYTKNLINAIPNVNFNDINTKDIKHSDIYKNNNYYFSSDFNQDKDWYEVFPQHFINCSLKKGINK